MKLRLTALSISSIDIKTVMMLRRSRNPATPRANKSALKIRYQESGTPCMLIELLLRQHHRPQNGNQDEHRNHFEGQQILREERASNIERGAVPEAAEVHFGRSWKHVLYEIQHQPQESEQERNPQHLREQGPAAPNLHAGIQQHNHEYE